MLEFAFGKEGEETIQMIGQWNAERNEEINYVATGVFVEIKNEIFNKFYADEITAEECARQL